MIKTKGFITFIILGALLVVNPGIAQQPIIISWPQPTPFGKTVDMNIDTTISTTSLNLGVPGGPQQWTYDVNVSKWQFDFRTLDVAGTPFAAAFPTAQWMNSILQYIPAFSIIQARVDSMYVYKLLEDGWIKELGMGSYSPIIQGSPFVYPTICRVYPNPLTWNSPSWTEKRQFNPLFLGIQNGTIKDSSVVSVDAWGTLNIPSGTYDCLRLKRHEFRFIDAGSYFKGTLETYTYVWLTHDFDMVLSVTADASKGENFTTAQYVIRATDLVGVDCDPECRTAGLIPTEFALGQNYPNPFNPTTSISYSLPKPSRIELKVHSILGHELATLESALKMTGEYSAVWDGKDMLGRQAPSGIYFYRLKATSLDGGETIVITKKMVLSK